MVSSELSCFFAAKRPESTFKLLSESSYVSSLTIAGLHGSVLGPSVAVVAKQYNAKRVRSSSGEIELHPCPLLISPIHTFRLLFCVLSSGQECNRSAS